MLRDYHRFFNALFQAFDLYIITFAWLISYPLRFLFLVKFIPVTKGFPLYDPYIYLFVVIVLLWHFSFKLNGVYQTWRTQSVWPELATLVRASALAFIILSTGTFLFTGDIFSRGVIIIFGVTSTSLLVAERIILRSVIKSLRAKGYNIRNTLIVGDNEVGAAFVERLRFHSELGLDILGVVRLVGQGDDDSQKFTGLKVLGESADISRILSEHRIDQVVITLRNSQRHCLEDILAALVDQNVDVRIVPDLSQFVTLGCSVENFEGLPLISLNESPIIGWNMVLKRVSDIIYATLALIVFSPLMLLIGVLIKIFTPGPVLISQERMGLDGRLFKMLKFRTMIVDAEKNTGAVWAKENDNRVTWLGRILRKISLDELPQLVNVLKGDMSCVGPRPERPSLVEKFRHDIPRYMLRHKVKSGMTGWAQINGWRGQTSLEKRIEYDLYYISHWSLFFDFKIMVLTFFKGFISKNAY